MVAAAVLAAGFAWTAHLVVAPDPWASDSALAIAIGCLVFTIAAVAALLLGRGRWTRYFATGLLIAELLIALVADFNLWLVAAVTLSGLALAGLGGPWFKGWLRERPAAGAPGWEPIALTITAFALVPLVGVAAPDGLQPAHGVAGALGILLSWGFMKGGTWALYGLRFGLPPVVLLTAFASPVGGTVLLIAAAAGLAYLAWTPAARLAVDPMPELPAPRKRRS
jgi:hypothetical protein